MKPLTASAAKPTTKYNITMATSSEEYMSNSSNNNCLLIRLPFKPSSKQFSLGTFSYTEKDPSNDQKEQLQSFNGNVKFDNATWSSPLINNDAGKGETKPIKDKSQQSLDDEIGRSDWPGLNQDVKNLANDPIWIGLVEYEPFKVPFPYKKSLVGTFINILIPNQFLASNNPAVMKRSFWGGQLLQNLDYPGEPPHYVYTDDSDIVCILQHVGFVSLSTGNILHPRPIKATFKISHRLSEYHSVEMNGLISREWISRIHTGFSLEFVGAKFVTLTHHKQRLLKRPIAPFTGISFKFTTHFGHRPILTMLASWKIQRKLDMGHLLQLEFIDSSMITHVGIIYSESTIKGTYHLSIPTMQLELSFLEWHDFRWPRKKGSKLRVKCSSNREEIEKGLYSLSNNLNNSPRHTVVLPENKLDSKSNKRTIISFMIEGIRWSK